MPTDPINNLDTVKATIELILLALAVVVGGLWRLARETVNSQKEYIETLKSKNVELQNDAKEQHIINQHMNDQLKTLHGRIDTLRDIPLAKIGSQLTEIHAILKHKKEL